MTDDPRVSQLLDELLASNATPEAVCKPYPELLPEIHKRWRRIRRLCADLDTLFPSHDEAPPQTEGINLPQIPGYEVEAVLGHGGMGVVYRARHLALKRTVALKMLAAGHSHPAQRARFKAEAEAVARLQHPNIVQIHEIGDAGGRPFIALEFVEGGSLANRLAGRPLPAHDAARLVGALAEAMHLAHSRNLVHRDLKPGNILLTNFPGTPVGMCQPKVADFGLARQLDTDSGQTFDGLVLGTPSYMAPEQAEGHAYAAGPAADVYALGAILYECLTGRPPFKGVNSRETLILVRTQEPVVPSTVNRKTPRDLETICLKCLHKKPEQRYASARELADDLGRFVRDEPVTARPVGLTERVVKWTRRHRSLAAFLAVGVLLLNVLAGIGVWVFSERSALKRTVTEDFDQVVLAQKERKWDQARTALERAKARLGGEGPPELRRRVDQLERELALVGTLEDILLARQESGLADGRAQRTAARYEAALREAGLFNGPENPALIAARIRGTGLAAPVLAALDDWAHDWAGHDDSRQDWLLEIARLVDDDPASRPIRDTKLWENKAALQEFARSAPLANQSVPFLIFLARKLECHGGDAMAFLKRMQQAHVNSYLANATLATSLLVRDNAAESLRFFQAAAALQPDRAGLRHNLGVALGRLGRWDEAIVELEEARRLVPDSAHYSTDIGRALNNIKRPNEAERHFRGVLESHPTYPPCLTGLAYSLFQQGRHEEAFKFYRQAIVAAPDFADAHRQLKERYMLLGRWEEGRQAWQQWLACNPPIMHVWEGHAQFWLNASPTDHPAWDGYAELCLYLGNEAEYRRARTGLLERFAKTTDPQIAERTGRACLLLPASEDELKQATALVDRASTADTAKYGWAMPYFRFAKALAEYRAGNLGSALALLDGDVLRILGPAPHLLLAMVQHRLGKKDAARESLRKAIAAYDWDVKKATNREAWMYHLLRREAEATVLPKLPVLLTGKDQM
ncbi:serine/threonine-protein kinase [Fimbriiglobus ruber]|uniref:Serine/threonine protein kinase PrkC, regulator of stationary phase n=1 Tax=Fimbriiglobus ruber TaxID=1908690 RepID=A0A225DB64_9BACT|nr:serine/threonine-protein kinase [Fimbriiglobus ruber]OWK38223.1 Serine/threonine protein kinase PrkC, regulator of stationary phase [Fimbriiglobus ruber]